MFKAYRKTYDAETDSYSSTLFYDDTSDSDAVKLTSAKLSLELGKAGSFRFKVPQTNTSYDRFDLLKTYVDLYRDDELVFCGRVFNVQKDINGLLSVECEGLLAVLNDSVLEPRLYENMTVAQLVGAMLGNHNSQVERNRWIAAGTISASSDYVYRDYEDFKSTFERFSDLVSTFGGYPSIKPSEGDTGLTLDWLSEDDYLAQAPATQTIDFGVNMLKLQQESVADDILTVIYPLGQKSEQPDGTSRNLDVSSIATALKPRGQKYIENAEAVAMYGRIAKVIVWDDVTDATRLYNKGVKYLDDYCRSRLKIDVDAVDMAKAGSSVEAYKIGDLIAINAELYGLEGVTMLCLKQSLDLMNPASNRMSLGGMKVGFIGSTSKPSAVDQDARDRIQNTNSRVNDLTNTVGNVNQQLSEAVGGANDRITDFLTSFDNFSEEESGRIKQGIREWYEGYVDADGNRVQGEREVMNRTYVEVNGEWVGAVNETRGNIDNWMHFDTDGVLELGRSNSAIVSQQDNSSYKFVDKDTAEVLLSLNGSKDQTGYVGITSQTAQLDQTVYKREGVPKWAVRVSDTDNLDFIWIG